MKEDKRIQFENEFDLHVKLVEWIRRFYPHALLAVCAGELQDSVNKPEKLKRHESELHELTERLSLLKAHGLIRPNVRRVVAGDAQ